MVLPIMFFQGFRPRSLKARVTVYTLMVFAISMALLAWYVGGALREDMERLLGDQQYSTAVMLANQFDEKLKERFLVLELIAGRIDAAMLRDPRKLENFLRERMITREFFNGGVYVVAADGRLLIGHDLPTGELDEVHDPASIAAVLQDGGRRIGRLIECTYLHAPLFDMMVPVRDDLGRIVGVLAGITRLDEDNFLDRIVGESYGRSGGVVVVAPRYRQIVTATDRRRVLEMLPPPGANVLVDRFVAGHEGYVVGRNALGEEMLMVSRRIPGVGWDIGVTLPVAEAFAPIRALQQRMLLGMALAAVLGGFLIWRLQARLLGPIAVATRALAAQQEANSDPVPLPVSDSRDEIAGLIEGFNGLLAALGERESRLLKSETFLALMAGSLEQQIAERTRQLNEISTQLAMTEERERRQLAEELHDNLGQLLAAIKIQLSMIDKPSLRDTIRCILTLVAEADDVVRTIVQHSSPPILKVIGLVPALESLREDIKRLYGLDVSLDIALCDRKLPEGTEALLYRSIRELLINAAKYAGIGSARLSIHCDGNTLNVVVHDEGRGFDPAGREEGGTGRTTFGLDSIRERIVVLGGDMSVTSGPGQGTTVCLRVPCSIVQEGCPNP